MARELVYTSSPQGILPGSHGFCTVAMSQGLPASMRIALESLTGYKAPPWATTLPQCPVEYLHGTVSAGGERFHVVGAVRAATPDHSGRSNKLAHFLILERGELDSNGPVALLRTEGEIRDSWNEAPTLLPPHRDLVPSIHRAPGICHTWQKLAGDPGWAGALVSDFILDASKPTHILVPPETDTLQLADEAVALLPPEWRWRITFSTYWQRSLPNHTCAWRFVFDGTQEAAALRQQGARMLDLVKGGPCPREGRYVEAARSGLLVVPDPTGSLPDEDARHQHQLRATLAALGSTAPERSDVSEQLAGHVPVLESAAAVPTIRERAPNAFGDSTAETPGAARTNSAGTLLTVAVMSFMIGGIIVGLFVWVGLRGDLDALVLAEQEARLTAGAAREAEAAAQTTGAAAAAAVRSLQRELEEVRRTRDGLATELANTKRALAASTAQEQPPRPPVGGRSTGTRAADPAAPPHNGPGTDATTGPATVPTTVPTTEPPAPAESGGPVRVVIVGTESGVLYDLGIDPTWPVEMKGLGDMLVTGVELKPEAGEVLIGDKVVARAKIDSNKWVWILEPPDPLIGVDLSAQGGYAGLLSGLWLNVGTGAERQTVALEVKGHHVPRDIVAGAVGASVQVPPWVKGVRLVGSDGTTALLLEGQPKTIPLPGGRGELVASLTREGVVVKATAIAPEALIDVAYYERCRDFANKYQKDAELFAEGDETRGATLLDLRKSYTSGTSSRVRPPLTSAELRAVTEECKNSKDSLGGAYQSIEVMLGARVASAGDDKEIMRDFAKCLEAIAALAKERLAAAKTFRDEWLSPVFAVTVDGLPSDATTSEAAEGSHAPGTLALIRVTAPESKSGSKGGASP